MEEPLIIVFQHQIGVQCEFLWRSYKELQDLPNHKSPTPVPYFAAIQSLIGAAAAIRRAMWGQDQATTRARILLRQTLDTDDSSAINSPKMRNNFEHFDARIDKWWKTSKREHFIDLNVSPPGMFPEQDEIYLFREYDPHTGNVSFWGDRLNVNELAAEAKRIHLAVRRELSKHPELSFPITPLE